MKKRCSKCGETKPRSEFHKERAAKDGLKSQCKDCRTEYQRSSDGKASGVKYRQSSKGKAVRAKADKKYRQSDHGKQVFKEGQAKYHRGIKGFLHRLFNSINQRCNNPEATGYKYWGGKGIECLFKSFDEFFYCVTVDLGYDSVEKLEGLHIHRIENNGHYEPDNIEFLTPEEHRAKHRKLAK